MMEQVRGREVYSLINPLLYRQRSCLGRRGVIEVNFQGERAIEMVCTKSAFV